MITRVSIAFDDAWNVAAPTWTRIDTSFPVEYVSVERGRDFEMDAHDVGRASVRFRDHTGDFDPTYTSGAYYLKCVPRVQVKIELENPVTNAVATIFRGYASTWRYEPHPTEQWNYVTLDLVDGMAIIAAAEILADGSFGDDVVDGNIVYQENTALTAVRECIVLVLDDVGWPGASYADVLRDINTGNVGLQKKPYPPRTSALTVIQEASEADLPAVAGGFFISRLGEARYMGRYTRLNPSNPDYGIQTWKLGDDAAAEASPSQIAPVAPPLVFYVDETHIYNIATCTPQGIADGDIAGQVASDSGSIDQYGPKNWSAENLRTANGQGPTTAVEETQLFSEFMVANYAAAQIRVESLTVLPREVGTPHAGRVWAVICGVELNDIVQLTHTMRWSGGFVANEFFVEKIRYEIEPLNDEIDLVKLTLDVSPGEYAEFNPFAGPGDS